MKWFAAGLAALAVCGPAHAGRILPGYYRPLHPGFWSGYRALPLAHRHGLIYPNGGPTYPTRVEPYGYVPPAKPAADADPAPADDRPASEKRPDRRY